MDETSGKVGYMNQQIGVSDIVSEPVVVAVEQTPSYSKVMAISSAQIRAARAWLDLTKPELARIANVSLNTLQAIERGYSDPRKSTLDKLERAFREAGIVFFDDATGSGIRQITEK